MAALLTGCAAQAAPAGSVAQIQYSPQSRYSGAVLTRPFSLPAQTFTDTGGVRGPLKAPAPGGVTLVFYGFTHCSDDCPTTLADIEAALRALPREQQDRISMDFVTSDPWRDDPATMRAWLDRYNTRFTGYTADWDTVLASAGPLGVDLEKPASFSGDYQVTHGLQVFGFTSDGKAHIEWLIKDIRVEQLRADLRLILAGTPIS